MTTLLMLAAEYEKARVALVLSVASGDATLAHERWYDRCSDLAGYFARLVNTIPLEGIDAAISMARESEESEGVEPLIEARDELTDRLIEVAEIVAGGALCGDVHGGIEGHTDTDELIVTCVQRGDHPEHSTKTPGASAWMTWRK